MSDIIENKISEAQEILKALGLPNAQQNKISALTLLALAEIKPDEEWQAATKRSLTLSKDIMHFVNNFYKANYAANSRESFRNNALKPFVQFNVAELNPDNPELKPSSSLTHYALTENVISVLIKYNTKEWEGAVSDFKKNQYPENKISTDSLYHISIRNYKSILYNTIELGRVNVFIGENGCGKSNILEALAVASSAKSNDLSFDGLYSRGVRIARPDLMVSSFLGSSQATDIEISLKFHCEAEDEFYNSVIAPENSADIYTKWIDKGDSYGSNVRDMIKTEVLKLLKEDKTANLDKMIDEVTTRLASMDATVTDRGKELLSEYSIYDLNTKSLRGITPVDSRKTPLGLNGEGLDLLIGSFNSFERGYLAKCGELFRWLDTIITDKEDKNKVQGLKPGRSSSMLYFTDKYMQKKNNILSAENSNEGILHVLFYLALFISNKTPKLFAIDNIETALNPKLCEKLIIEINKLAKLRGKQVLITTHNPAILDGLDLSDDNQRLFEVYRNSNGHTQTRRIKFKTDLSDKKFKLSEMWMKGSLGAIPEF